MECIVLDNYNAACTEMNNNKVLNALIEAGGIGKAEISCV